MPQQRFPHVDAPGGIGSGLRASIDHICQSPATLDRAALLRREDQVASAAHDSHASAATWVELGCVRGALAGDGAIARPGLLMVAGNSWAHGAERAMMQALALESGNVRAAGVLGTLALNDPEPDDLKAGAIAVIEAATIGAPSPAVLHACAELALRIDNAAASRRCALRGLALGADSTWHLLRLARLAFRDADTLGGVRFFLTAMGSVRDSVARNEAGWHLQWFLSPDEQRQLVSLAPAALVSWVRDRLMERDVRDCQPTGARLAEHFRRLEFVLTNFRLSLAQVAVSGHGLVGVTPMNHQAPEKVAAFCEPGMIPALPFRDYSAWQDRIDDRGVVWLRYGAPAKRIRRLPSVRTGSSTIARLPSR